jgi:mannitol-1-phosphate 5-dehydrogenase
VTDRPRIVIIGAGATGRGQIGQLAHDAGFAVTFIERDRDLVERLRRAGRYSVVLAGETTREIEVSGFEALRVEEVEARAEAIAEADIVATAVLPTHLESTVPTLAAGLALRRARQVGKPLNVIACENMERSSSTLREYLRRGAPELDWAWVDGHVGFPDAMVARAVPVPEDPLVLLAEADQEWSVDARQVKPPMPPLAGMTLSDNQEAALERKLYIKNTGHFAIGVLGWLKGHRLMHEAARDPEVFAQVNAATRESAAAVAAKHGFPAEATEAYRAAFLAQMKSPFLPDEVKRVIREPIRKLGREERLVGPAMLAWECTRPPVALARVIAAVFRLVNPQDPEAAELQARLGSQGPEAVLEQVCKIPRGHPLIGLILRAEESKEERVR